MTAPRRPPRSNGRLSRLLSAVSGALTVGMVLLALALLLATLFGGGAALSTVIVHIVAAAVCVVLQRFSDRYPGIVRRLCASGVVVICLVILALYWWF